jgi:hypothetical protein
MSQVPTTPTTGQFPFAPPTPPTRVGPVTGDPDYYTKLEAIANADGPWSVSNLVQDVVDETWFHAYAARWAARVRAGGVEEDPNFDIFSRWDDFTQGVDPAYWRDIAAARSEDEANVLKAQFQDNTDRRARIAGYGISGTTAMVAASFLDPLNVAIMAVSAPVASAVGVARGGFLATRAGQAVTSGLINAGGQLPMDILRADDDPNMGTAGVIGNALGNFAFGAQQPFTAGLGRAQRFLIGGGAQSLGAPLQFGGDDMTGTEFRVALATQFVFGGAFNAIPSVRNSYIDAESVRIADLAPDIQTEADIAAAVSMGVGTPSQQAETVLQQVRSRREAPVSATANFGRSILQFDETGAIRNPMTDRNNTIITGGDISTGGTSIAARMAGFSRVTLDDSFRPGDYDTSNITFDKMTGAEGVLSRMSVFSQGSQMAQSDAMPIRLASAAVVGDMRGENAASLLVQRGARQRGYDSQWRQAVESTREAYNKVRTQAGGEAVSAEDFDRAVMAEYRRATPSDQGISPAVEYMRQKQAEFLAEAKRKGDPSAMDVPDGSRHPLQQWNREKIDAAISTLGAQRVKEALAESIMPAARRRAAEVFSERNGDQMLFAFREADQQQILEEVARIKAESMAESIIRNGGTQKDALAQIDGLPVEATRGATIARYRSNPNLRSLSDAQLEAFVSQELRDQAVPPIYRAAIELDQDYTHEWMEPAFGPGTSTTPRSLRIADMLEDSAENAMKRLHTAHEGRMAMLELERAMSSVMQPGGGTSNPARERLFVTPAQFNRWMIQQLTDGVGELSSADQSALNALAHHVRILSGAPAYVPGTDRAEGVYRMFKGAQTLTSARAMMNNTAPIQNITELATALSHSHPEVVARAVPQLEQAMKALANGVDDPTLRHYAFVLGMGQNLSSGRPLAMLDDGNVAMTGGGQSSLLKAGRKVQNFGQQASHYAYKFSGNTSSQDAVEIGVTMVGMEHFHAAADGKINWRPIDLEQFGLSQQRFESLIADMKAHRVKNDLGFWDLNEDQWQPENAAAFRRALLGWTTRYGNVMNAGLMPSYFTDNIAGQVVTQMSRFGIQSWQNRALQPAFNVARAAPGHKGEALAMAATSYLTQSVGASLAYSLGVFLSSIGRPDAEDYRARMLAPETLALTLYSRAAWASMSPRLVDMGLQLSGTSPIFAPMRSSGVGTGSGPLGVVGQTPLGSWIYSAFGMPHSVGQALFDDEYEWTTRNMSRLEEMFLFPSSYLNLRNINAHLYQTVGIPTPQQVQDQAENTRTFVPAGTP